MLRKAAGFTQATLAFYAEVDEKTIRRIEKGEHSVSMDLLISLAQALRVNPAQFFEGMKIDFEE